MNFFVVLAEFGYKSLNPTLGPIRISEAKIALYFMSG